MTPDDIVNEISESKLRGRGGGGFPTGKKWAQVKAQKAEQKYVVCNGDEGDPGAFMDRSIMEGDPQGIANAFVPGLDSVPMVQNHFAPLEMMEGTFA